MPPPNSSKKANIRNPKPEIEIPLVIIAPEVKAILEIAVKVAAQVKKMVRCFVADARAIDEVRNLHLWRARWRCLHDRPPARNRPHRRLHEPRQGLSFDHQGRSVPGPESEKIGEVKHPLNLPHRGRLGILVKYSLSLSI